MENVHAGPTTLVNSVTNVHQDIMDTPIVNHVIATGKAPSTLAPVIEILDNVNAKSHIPVKDATDVCPVSTVFQTVNNASVILLEQDQMVKKEMEVRWQMWTAEQVPL